MGPVRAVGGELRAVRVMDNAVEDGTGQSGIADGLVPAFDGALSCNDGRCASIAVFENFRQIAAPGGGWNGQSPVIKNEDTQLGDGLGQAGVASVTPCQCERF